MTSLDLSLQRMRRFLGAIALGAALIMLVGLAVVLGPALESRYWPVLSEVRYQVVSRDADRMTLDWWGDRKRPECILSGVSALVKTTEGWLLAVLSPAGDVGDGPIPLTTRPPGHQKLRRIDVIPAGSEIAMRLQHRCHALWPTVTHIPAVKLD